MARGAASPVSRVFTALTSVPSSFASPPQDKARMDRPLLPFRCAAAAGELQKDQWHLLQIRDYKGSKWEQALCRGEREFWGANWGRRKEKHPSTPHWLSHWILLSRFSTYSGPFLALFLSQPTPEEVLTTPKSLFPHQIPGTGYLCRSWQLSNLFLKLSTLRSFMPGHFMNCFHLFALIFL